MERDFSKIYFKHGFGNQLLFPKSEAGHDWRWFRNTSVFLAIFVYVLAIIINKFIYIPLAYTKMIKLFCFGIVIFSSLGYFNNIRKRWLFFEREVAKNDKKTAKFKKLFHKRFDMETKSESLRNKEKKSKDDNKHLKAISLFNNAIISINTRQELNHEVNRYYSILFPKPKDDTIDKYLYKYITDGGASGSSKGNSNNKDLPAVANTARSALYDLIGANIPFSAIKTQPNGDYYIEAIENLGIDPWYYTQRTTDLREYKRSSTMEHSVPYKPTTYYGIEFSGFADYTKENEILIEKARNWVNENIGSILNILSTNGFDVQFVPETMEFRQSSVEIKFVMPSNLKAGTSKNKIYMDIAEVIDQKLDIAGSSLKPNLDRLNLSLSLPNGKTGDGVRVKRDDNGEIQDYRLKLNLEDILRDLYG